MLAIGALSLAARPVKITPIIRLQIGLRAILLVGVRVRMNMDDSRLIASFQLLITEMLTEKRLGQRRPGLTDELYQTWLEVEQRGLKKTPEYRNVLLRADRHALWLAGLVMLSNPNAASPLSSKETEPIATLSAAA